MEPHLAEDEELQKLKQWWKKNGSSIIVGVVLGISAIAGINGWRMYEQNQAETASALFGQLREAISGNSASKASSLATELRDDFSSTPYAPSGALIYAAHVYASGDEAAAREQLEWVIDSGASESLKHTARVRLAWLELAAGNHQRVLQITAVEDVSGFESYYAELKAEAHAMAGDRDKARSAYATALAELPENSDYAEILKAKQNALESAGE